MTKIPWRRGKYLEYIICTKLEALFYLILLLEIDWNTSESDDHVYVCLCHVNEFHHILVWNQPQSLHHENHENQQIKDYKRMKKNPTLSQLACINTSM